MRYVCEGTWAEWQGTRCRNQNSEQSMCCWCLSTIICYHPHILGNIVGRKWEPYPTRPCLTRAHAATNLCHVKSLGVSISTVAFEERWVSEEDAACLWGMRCHSAGKAHQMNAARTWTCCPSFPLLLTLHTRKIIMMNLVVIVHLAPFAVGGWVRQLIGLEAPIQILQSRSRVTLLFKDQMSDKWHERRDARRCVMWAARGWGLGGAKNTMRSIP